MPRIVCTKAYESIPAVTTLVARFPELVKTSNLTDEQLIAIDTIIVQYENHNEDYDADFDEVPCSIRHAFGEDNLEIACEYVPCTVATLVLSAYNTAAEHQDIIMMDAMRKLMSAKFPAAGSDYEQ